METAVVSWIESRIPAHLSDRDVHSYVRLDLHHPIDPPLIGRMACAQFGVPRQIAERG